ncbi:MAG: methyl-accepting chemotaxis protein, partial [Pseudomonadaceae bacterium]
MLKKSLRAQILALIGGSLLLLLVIALLCIQQLSHHVEHFGDLLDGPLSESQLVDEANLEFKIQVQEWKNVLLRGKNPEQRNKYWAQFQAQERKVQELLGQLQRASAQSSQLSGQIARLQNEHRLLGEAYRKGFDAFIAAGADPTAGDAAVAGIDRAASAQMSELVSQLRQTAARQSTEIREGAGSAALTGVLVMLLASALVGLLSLWLVNRNIIEPTRSLIEHIARLSQ